jgi:hypothetical protein
LAVLTGVRWNLNVALICIFLIAKDSEHFKIYLLYFREVFVQTICPFIDLITCAFVVKSFGILYLLGILVLCQMNDWQRFSPIIKAISSLH